MTIENSNSSDRPIKKARGFTTGFNHFCKYWRNAPQHKHFLLKLKNNDINKMIGAEWSKMSLTDKALFFKLGEESRQQFIEVFYFIYFIVLKQKEENNSQNYQEKPEPLNKSFSLFFKNVNSIS